MGNEKRPTHQRFVVFSEIQAHRLNQDIGCARNWPAHDRWFKNLEDASGHQASAANGRRAQGGTEHWLELWGLHREEDPVAAVRHRYGIDVGSQLLYTTKCKMVRSCENVSLID